MSATTSPPNGYDLSVVKWMERNDGYIAGYVGDFKLYDVSGDECHDLRVTRKMVERLEAADLIRQQFRKGATIWDETYQLKRP